MENEKLQVVESTEAINQMEKASIDTQISTAKAYPRSIRQSTDNSIATVTLNEKTAQTCGYVLRFRGTEIKGKSVYLARILAQQWGNLRCESGILSADATHVKSYAIAFDLETNYATRKIVEKPIIKKDGTRYSQDMIAVAGAAAAAIAYRNAVLEVIPQAVSDEVYEAAERKVIGNLSKEDRLISKRKEMLTIFKDTYKVTEDQILKYFGVRSADQLDPHKVKELIDMNNAFTDGTLNIDDVFSLPTDVENNASYAKDLEDAEKQEGKQPEAKEKKE